MILEISLYILVLMIVGMVVFKIVYNLYVSIKPKKSFEEIKSLSELERIIDGLKCPRDFHCYKSVHNSLDKKTAGDMKSFLFCFKEKLRGCAFSVPSESKSSCKCPLRDYIVRELDNSKTT
jgi:hypothetical protein